MNKEQTQDQFNYKWDKKDEFIIDGETFQNIINLTRSILDTPEAVKVTIAQAVSSFIEKSLIENIQTGKVKVFKNGELIDPPKQEEEVPKKKASLKRK